MKIILLIAYRYASRKAKNSERTAPKPTSLLQTPRPKNRVLLMSYKKPQTMRDANIIARLNPTTVGRVFMKSDIEELSIQFSFYLIGHV
jgi:hypothetical protein